MTNPFNPLDWIRSTQDWFARTERSSGFRSYLIFMILVFSFAACLLAFFPDIPYTRELAIGLIGLTVVAFVVIFAIKAFQDPQFCRSEKHVERILQLEVEFLGTETTQFAAEIVEQQLLNESVPDSQVLPPPPGGEPQV